MSRIIVTVRDQDPDGTSVDTDIAFAPGAEVRIIRGALTMDAPVSTVIETDVYMLGQGLKLVDIIGVTVED